MCNAHTRYQKKVSNQLIELTSLTLVNFTLDVTWAVVKRQLAVEDHLEVEAGSAFEGHVTPSAFLVAALELEEAQ